VVGGIGSGLSGELLASSGEGDMCPKTLICLCCFATARAKEAGRHNLCAILCQSRYQQDSIPLGLTGNSDMRGWLMVEGYQAQEQQRIH
jgi:hypothetical protein